MSRSAHRSHHRGKGPGNPENRKLMHQREKARVAAAAYPDRYPVDSKEPIGRDVLVSSTFGRKEVLREDWNIKVTEISAPSCQSRDACLDDVSERGWKGIDCRQCPHWETERDKEFDCVGGTSSRAAIAKRIVWKVQSAREMFELEESLDGNSGFMRLVSNKRIPEDG